ncbi:hypothetical protein NEUTE2DRAFT_135544 [Neurospora tetrasperma FGSC 2509]|nr:hypothetical protein NEUTE2DRAFT_135544 [Neurospora tetrasperma FGSC 2509]
MDTGETTSFCPFGLLLVALDNSSCLPDLITAPKTQQKPAEQSSRRHLQMSITSCCHNPSLEATSILGTTVPVEHERTGWRKGSRPVNIPAPGYVWVLHGNATERGDDIRRGLDRPADQHHKSVISSTTADATSKVPEFLNLGDSMGDTWTERSKPPEFLNLQQPNERYHGFPGHRTFETTHGPPEFLNLQQGSAWWS